MLRKLLLAIGFGLATALFPTAATAACSGGGLVWSCTAGSTQAQVNTAIAAATNGATITLDNGTYNWNVGSTVVFDSTKGVSIICATLGGCVLNTSGRVFMKNVFTAGTNNNLYRVSGFTWYYSDSGQRMVTFDNGGTPVGSAGNPAIMSQVRFDHNALHITGPGDVIWLTFADNAIIAYVFGLVDNNTISSDSSFQLVDMFFATNGSPMHITQNEDINNLFIEDNNIAITTMTNAGRSLVDAYGSARIVFRHNTYLNGLIGPHGVTHTGGTDYFAVYNNQGSVDSGAAGVGEDDGYRLFHHQGSGQIFALNNVFSAPGGHSTSVQEVIHYRDYSGNAGNGGPPYCDGTQGIDENRSSITMYRGYRCWRQPGSDVSNGKYAPMFGINNKWDTGAIVDLLVPDGGYASPDYQPNHLQANRDYFNGVSLTAQTSASSPFNGTVGAGFGITSRRPTTCTTSSESALSNGTGGVMYYDITLNEVDTCSALNTWSLYWRSFTYPHPLQGVSGTPTADLDTSSINFGSVITGTTSGTATVTLANNGTATLNIISIVKGGADPTKFNLVNSCGSTLAPTVTCTFTVSFSPTSSVSYSATVVVTTDAATSPGTVTLAGTGVPAAATVPSFSNAFIGGNAALQ